MRTDGNKASVVAADHIRRRFARAFMLFAFVAIFTQTFVIQTHVDGLGLLRPAIERTVGAVAQTHPDHVRATTPADAQVCVICQAAATAGGTVLAAGPALISAHGILLVEARARAGRVYAPPTHSWQSRAPPIAL